MAGRRATVERVSITISVPVVVYQRLTTWKEALHQYGMDEEKLAERVLFRWAATRATRDIALSEEEVQ